MAWTVLEIFWIGYVSLLTYLMPYTKVEESFNMQAVYDLLVHGRNITAYDHNEFPGVVPRTFIGPIVLATIVKPIQFLFQTFNWRIVHLQLFVRLVLGWILSYCLIKFKHALPAYFKDGFHKRMARNFMLISLSQFHLAFYSSRPLPNIFALSLALLSLAHYLQRHWTLFIIYAGVVILLFRCELSLLFGPLLLIQLLKRRVHFLNLCLVAVPTLVITIGVSVLVDSFFWRKWIWPEGYVLWYNTVLNMSHHWGTQPFFWYFYSVLPRCLLFSLPFAVLGGLQSSQNFELFGSTLIFLFIYSWLPHKELRFIIYVVPILNALAAKGLETAISYATVFVQQVLGLYHKRTRLVLQIILYSHLVLNVLCSIVFIMAAFYNYPGGTAMVYLHDGYSQVKTSSEISVHVGNYAAQTGVTRFLHENQQWRYNKSEGFEDRWDILKNFTFLLVEIQPSSQKILNENNVYLGLLPETLRKLLSTHSIIATFSAFSGLTRHYPFIRLEEKIALLSMSDIPTT